MKLGWRWTHGMGIFLTCALSACEKVPLHANPGSFDVLAAHYFEKEKTQYLFFAVSGLKPEQTSESWPRQLEIKADGLAEANFAPAGDDGFSVLDMSRGVYRHHWVNCGEGRICGSMSLRSDRPLSGMRLRFRYHRDSVMSLSDAIPNSSHPADGTMSAESAIVYGVFSRGNQALQVRVHNNFGTPTDEEFKNFGMDRDFAIDHVRLAKVTPEEQAAVEQATGTPLLFPAAPCTDRDLSLDGDGGAVRVQKMSGKPEWWKATLDPRDDRNVACFRARLLDKSGAEVTAGPAIARRNPEVQAEALVIPTPLRPVYQIPLVLSYCPDPSSSTEMSSADFLHYQKYILGIPPEAGVDLCFAAKTGEDVLFAKQLEMKIAEKLAAARVAVAVSAHPTQDLFFTVAINHRMVGTRYFHEKIIEKLSGKIRQERELQSPRLVGAFVYDSQTLEERGLELPNEVKSTMVWCPRKSERPELTDNCVGFVGGKIDLGPVTFKVPMGPFPTLDNFDSFRTSDVNGLLVRDPRIEVSAFQTNANTAHIPQGTATFFDGQRVSLGVGEGLRFCGNRDQELLGDRLALRVQDVETGQLQYGALSDGTPISGQRAVNVNFGMIWRYPFFGGVSYKAPVEGRIFSFIPISKSFTASETFGDRELSRSKWEVGPLLQKCTRFCDHPSFDEAGVYQAGVKWRMGPSHSCVEAKMPDAPGESGL